MDFSSLQIPFPELTIAGMPWLLFVCLALVIGMLAASILRYSSPKSHPAPTLAPVRHIKGGQVRDIEIGLGAPSIPDLPPRLEYASQLIEPPMASQPRALPPGGWQPSGHAFIPPPVLASGFSYIY